MKQPLIDTTEFCINSGFALRGDTRFVVWSQNDNYDVGRIDSSHELGKVGSDGRLAMLIVNEKLVPFAGRIAKRINEYF